MSGIGLRWDCPRCGTRHVLACCHASRHNLCDLCVREQHADRAARTKAEVAPGGETDG